MASVSNHIKKLKVNIIKRNNKTITKQNKYNNPFLKTKASGV